MRPSFEHAAVDDAVATPPHPSRVEDWDPETYSMFASRAIGPIYEDLHAAVLAASLGPDVRRILDLGAGTGEACRRLLEAHERASVVAVDANRAMLDAAAMSLPAGRVTCVQARLEDPLPPGPFDLVVSVLAVHHLNDQGKADLFARVRDVLAPHGSFLLGDAVCDPATPPRHRPVMQRLVDSVRNEGLARTAGKIARWTRSRASGGYVDYDDPALLVDQLAWLSAAGLDAEVMWEKELSVVVRARHRAAALDEPARARSRSN